MESTSKVSKHSLYSVKPIETVTTPKYSINYKRVQLAIDANVKVVGSVTGNRYVFNGAGSVVDVDERDVDNLLEKRQGGRRCCGGTGYGNQMFVLA